MKRNYTGEELPQVIFPGGRAEHTLSCARIDDLGRRIPEPGFRRPFADLVEVDLRADRLENSLRWGGPRSLGKSFSCVDATDQDGDGHRAAARLGELPVETRRCAPSGRATRFAEESAGVDRLAHPDPDPRGDINPHARLVAPLVVAWARVDPSLISNFRHAASSVVIHAAPAAVPRFSNC